MKCPGRGVLSPPVPLYKGTSLRALSKLSVRDLCEAEPRLRQASQEKAEVAGRPPLLQSKGQLRGSACVLPQLPQVAFFGSCALHHVALAPFPGY